MLFLFREDFSPSASAKEAHQLFGGKIVTQNQTLESPEKYNNGEPETNRGSANEQGNETMSLSPYGSEAFNSPTAASGKL